ncbi:MAG: hypothetical protein IIA45_01675 [Bacteroidetes bacterium]|nr:hypothetical protein [Bacteroidota bacterium]
MRENKVNHSQNGHSVISNNSEHSLLRSIINKRKWLWFLALGIFIVIYSAYFFPPKNYTSEVIIFDSNSDVRNIKFFMDQYNGIRTDELNYTNRINSLVFSKEVIQYIILKYDLYEYYHVDKSNPYHYEILYNKIYQQVKVKKGTYNSVIISVSDRDGIQAADMANDIAAQVVELNQNLIVGNIEFKISQYKKLLVSFDNKTLIKVDSLKQVLSLLNNSIKESNKTSAGADDFAEPRTKLNHIIYDLETFSKDLISANEQYQWLLQALTVNQTPSIAVIKPAAPQANQSYIMRATMGGGLMIASLFLSVLILVVYETNKYYFTFARSLFRWEN